MFTNEFLDLDIPLNIKEYYMTLQRFLLGKVDNTTNLYCYFNNTKLSELTGLCVPTVKKYNAWLIEHDYMSEEITPQRDEAGLPVIQKNFNLEGLCQASLWVRKVTEAIVKHDEEINKHNQEINALKKEIAELRADLKKTKALQRNAVPQEIEVEL